MIPKMKPLANSEPRREGRECIDSHLCRAILAEQSHVKVPIIGGALGLLVACRRGPALRQVVEAVPMDAFDPADQQLRRAADAPFLHLLRSEGGRAHLG